MATPRNRLRNVGIVSDLIRVCPRQRHANGSCEGGAVISHRWQCGVVGADATDHTPEEGLIMDTDFAVRVGRHQHEPTEQSTYRKMEGLGGTSITMVPCVLIGERAAEIMQDGHIPS
jgi:hypothetical protein